MNSGARLESDTSMLSGTIDNEEDSMIFAMPKSPGSFLGSSIRSNQVDSFDAESESCSVMGENPGWRLGMPWFSNNNQNRDSRPSSLKIHEVNRYYGGIMKASGESSIGPASPSSTTSNSSRHFRPFRKNNKRSNSSKEWKSDDNHTNHIDVNRRITNKNKKDTKKERIINDNGNASVPIARTKSNTADSLADFDESEWTPPDSSYGAACPVCGFIPKRVRQMIEMTLIAAMVFFLIYLVVTTSMKIAEAHRRDGRVDGNTASGSAADSYFNGNNYNRTGSSSSLTDDDAYLEKYSNNNNNNDDGNGNGDDAAAAAVDDNYIDDYNNNGYDGDDSEWSYSQNYGNSNNQNYNYYRADDNQNYNYYNKNRRYYRYNDDYNGRRRWLRGSRDRRIFIQTKKRIFSID